MAAEPNALTINSPFTISSATSRIAPGGHRVLSQHDLGGGVSTQVASLSYAFMFLNNGDFDNL